MKKGSPALFPVVAVDRASATPFYRQLYDAFRDAILERRLRAGQRVPSTRALAAELRISRLPILNAFEQLVAEGYFESGIGSGTFVARSVPGKPGGPDPASAGSSDSRRRKRPVSPDTDFFLRKESDPWLGGWGGSRGD